MELIRKFLNSLKTERSKAAKVKNTAPTYFSDMKWYQNPEKSIVTDDNRYDLNNFSEHEIDTIKHVIKVVKKNILSNLKILLINLHVLSLMKQKVHYFVKKHCKNLKNQ